MTAVASLTRVRVVVDHTLHNFIHRER